MHRYLLIVAIFFITSLFIAQMAGAGVLIEWSRPDIAFTPVGNVQFHGPFARDNIEVTCDGFPKHEFLRISFDLLIIHTWDGNWKLDADGLPVEIGPDSFRLGLKNGPTLLYTTFSNVPYVADSRFQNFPSPVPGDAMPAQCGAKETDTHGFLFPDFVTNPAIKQDSTYHIEFIVPHRAESAVVQMQGINLQHVLNESWGVSDFQVKPLAVGQVPTLTIDEISAAFNEALRPDSDKRMEAFAKLVCGMDATVTWLKINVAEVPIDGKKAARLAKTLSLDDRSRDARDKAVKELLRLGPQVESFLRDERNAASAEGRCRIDMLLQSVLVTPISNDDLRRVMLATRVLEIIGTPAAKELRKQLISR